MPYGPAAGCVVPALMPPEVKADAAAHYCHVLPDHAGPESDPVVRYLALLAVAGCVARFGATAVLNEDARTACPAFDLIPADGEDVFATLRALPITYPMVGFVMTNVGAPDRPWARTFNADRFDLPDLAYQGTGHGEWGAVFRWFAASLGYARETGATLAAGQTVDVAGGAVTLTLSAPPARGGDLLESDGEMLVVARA